MERPGSLVEAPWIDKESSSFFNHKGCEFWESEIVADAESHFAVLGIEDTDLISWDKSF